MTIIIIIIIIIIKWENKFWWTVMWSDNKSGGVFPVLLWCERGAVAVMITPHNVQGQKAESVSQSVITEAALFPLTARAQSAQSTSWMASVWSSFFKVREQLLHKSIVIWVISRSLLVVVTSSHCAVLHLKCAASAIYRELSQNTIYGKLGSHAHSPVFNANAALPSHESHANAVCLSLSLFLSSSRAGVIVTLLMSFFLALKIRLNFLASFCLSAMFVDSFVSRFLLHLLHRCRFFSSFFLFARGVFFFLKNFTYL